MFGKNVRMERIVGRRTGSCVIVPMDHGIHRPYGRSFST